jgi:predicted secreted protein
VKYCAFLLNSFLAAMVYSVVGMADTEEAPTRPARTNRPQPRQQNSGLIILENILRKISHLKKSCSGR